MLKLRNICKYYKVNKDKKIVLDNINIDFKNHELVFILGASGSGKSTLINIIGGNLKCDSGEIYLNNQLISNFNSRKFDSYRASVVGNVFQDYNLIDYMNVWDNVMLGYTKGLSLQEINLLLKQLKIYDKRKVVVSKLSGGEKQRVAIARALVNNPKIILADEPTGALDSAVGIEIMEILKKLSEKKLVIVVSHDNYLANKYADRIINIKDGKCEYFPQIDNIDNIKIDKRKIRKKAIFKLAFKNLWLKKIRTLFTSLAISLGIISMMIVLCLSINFNTEIDKLEKEIVSIFPITINNGDFEIVDSKVSKSDEKILIKNREEWVHTNVIDKEYIDYINNIDEIKYIDYKYDISLPFISDSYEIIDNNYIDKIINDRFILDNYQIIYGRNIQNENEVLLKIDSNNNVDSDLLNAFSIYNDIDYSEIIGRKLKVLVNDEYYIKNRDSYLIRNDISEMYKNAQLELVIVGIVKEKEIINDNSLILYSNGLLDKVLEINKNSQIVKSQFVTDKNILGINISKEEMLSYLGYNSLPSGINIYVDSIYDKEKVIAKLDEYNLNNDKLVYIDTMADAIGILEKFILIISIILIIFSLIAFLISALMIGILTNVRVLERKKEIGVFRSLGASRGNIIEKFNIENMMIGSLSFAISIFLLFVSKNFINQLLYKLLEIENLFIIRWKIVLGVFLFNLLVIFISSIIPIKKASKMEIVKCIYNR